MALGEAFITIRADTSKFKQDLSNQLKATLADAQKKTDGYTKSQVDAAKKANQAIVSAERDAYKQRDAMARAAAQGKADAERAYERDFKALLRSETDAAKVAAKEQSAAVTAAAREKSAAERKSAAEMEAASRDAGRQMVAISKAAAAEQIAAQRAVAVSAREAAAAQATAAETSKNFARSAASAVSGIGSTITASIVKPLEYTAIAAGAAAAAIGFFGIKTTGNLQNVQVAFEGIIGASKEFNGNLEAGRKAGDDFFATLQQFAKATPFRFQDLGKASQQLLAIGFNSKQVIGALTDVGNTLALTGDLSADRLNNVVLAITQINALGKVTRDNIRQITSNAPTFNQQLFVQQIANLQAIKDRGAGAIATTADLAKAQKDLGNGAVPASIGVQALFDTMRNTPGAAGAMARSMTTLTGVLSNFQDSLQIATGAAILPQLPAIQKGLDALTPVLADALGQIAPAVTDLVVAFGPFLGQVLPAFVELMKPVLNIFQNLLAVLGPALVGVFGALTPVFQALVGPLTAFAQQLVGALLPVLPQLTDALVQLVPSLAALATALIPLAPLLVQLVSQGIVILAELLPPLIPFIQLFASALTAVMSIPGGSAVLAAIALAVGGIAVAINAIIGPLTAILKLLPLLGIEFDVALLPVIATVGGVVLAVAALGIAFAIAWNKSKTFQAIVVAAINGIKDVIIDWVQINAKLILGFFDLIISGAAHAFGWIPGLGGKLKSANDKFDEFSNGVNDALNAIKDRDVHINGDASGFMQAVRDATKAYNAAGFFGPALPTPIAPTGLHTSTSTGSSAIPTGSQDFSGGGTDNTTDTKGQAAAAKAKAAAEKIKTALADLKGDFKAIGDATSKLTAAQIKTNFNALIKDLKDSGHKALAAQAKIIEDQLIADAKKLKTKQDTLAAELAIAQPIKNSVIDLGNISTPTQGIGQTFLGIENQLNGAIAKAQAFGSAVKSLQREGLDPALLKQIIDAGPVAGYTAAQALLSGGQAGINLINGKQAILTGLGNDLANQVTPELFEAGKHVGDGLLEGLKSQEQALASEMDHIADLMIKAFNKKIGAHSPSTVFATGGDNIAAGLAMGLDRSNGTISGAMGRVSSTVINFGAGSIAVNGSVPRPESTGMLLGSGLTSVLAGRQTQAALNGTG